ncbi:MAG: hypothetical protein LBJ14_00125 [Desulfarculales bacterium]|jgi:hypothetical protein|nr:hypothetical protein [Desulfarculales bacterium]
MRFVNKVVLAVSLMLFGMASWAGAACTQEELLAKAQEVQTKLTALAQQDPQKATAVTQEMMKATQITNNDEACKFYDDLLAQIEAK